MSKAEELADALDAMRIDPALCHHMVVPEVEAAAAELRRLAALEKAIMDAEPVAWIRPSGKAMLEAGGYCTVYLSSGMSNHSEPLYTLNGIKP